MEFTEMDSLLVKNRPSTKEKFRKSFNCTWALPTLIFTGAAALIIFVHIAVTNFNSNPSGDFIDGVTLLGQRSRSQSASFPSVTTSLGRVTGVNLTSREGREYFGFYNIPYSRPPVGDFRFEAPAPPTAWEGTLDATKRGIQCMQKDHFNPETTLGQEDCLHLNIFTPKLPGRFARFSSSPGLPVLVYNGGGGFTYGAADDIVADYFMDEEVIVVIVDSRLGALGWLNTGDSVAPGNNGFKDQIQALRWVQEHISNFGGDPGRVVAFGSSSGAMGSHATLLSPMAAGLISGVISFSGNMLSPGSWDPNPGEKAKELGNLLGCPIEDSVALVDCLRGKTAQEITLAAPSGTPSLEMTQGDVFLPDDPYNVVMEGGGNNVPWLVGVNSAEMIGQSYDLLADENTVQELNHNFDKVMKPILFLDGFTGEEETQVDEIMDRIRHFYFGNQTIDKDSLTRYNLTNLISDRSIIHPTKVAGLQHAQNNAVYWYYLTKEANVTWAKDSIIGFDPPYGVSHADEVQYVFPHPGWPYIPMDDPLFEFSKLFVKLLVSFAVTGAPVNPDPNGAEWTKVDPDSQGSVWFNLDDVPKPLEPFAERLALWESFPQNILYNTSAVG